MMSLLLKGTTTKKLFKWPWRSESELSTRLLVEIPPEIELSDYRRLLSSDCESPPVHLHGEDLKAELIPDLDIFFERLYEYFCAKGLRCIIVKWIIEILNVTFMVCSIGFFFLFVDWGALGHLKCGVEALESGEKPCDLMKVIKNEPLVPFTFVKMITIGSMGILMTYGIINFVKFFLKLRSMLKVRYFYYNSLKVTDLEIQTISWPKVVEKVVLLQKSQQLCVVKDLSEHDIIMRIMRKQNYLIGMVNKGIIAFPVPCWLPGVGPTVSSRVHGRKSYLMVPKTLEWTLNWCLFQSMFDSKFCVRKDFLTSSRILKKRLVCMGIAMLLLSPCLVIFPLVYMFLRHAEEFYNHPSTASSRRWSNLSRWILREYNEVEHFFRHRMNNCTVHSLNYLKQFPTPLISIIAKFISFVSGGLAGILLILGFLDESILEGHVFGRNLLWYAVIFGTIAAISRKVVADDLQVIDPEGAMTIVVQQTHYMPKRWRGKESSDLVRKEFETLFQYTITMLLEEMASIFITPYLLIFVVPKCVNDILHFISDFTVYVDGVGDVCSLSLFDFQRHGNRNYGSPCDAVKDMRSSQGKMEKSLLSFQSTYTSWEPNPEGKQFLCNLQRFKEKQIRKNTFQAMEDSQLGSSTRGQSGNLFHRLLPRDIHPGDGIICNFIPLGPLDADQRSYPYILDWYYTCHPHSGRDANSSPHLGEASPEPGEDIWPPLSKPLTEIEEEQIWDSNLYERARSHLEASTSSAFFQRATSQRQVREQNSTSHHWWAQATARPNHPQGSFIEPPPHSFIEPPDMGNHHTAGQYSSQHCNWALSSAQHTDPQDSFLEPPNFGNHYTSGYHSSYHSSDASEGNKELDQRYIRSNSSWRRPPALSKTGYMDDDPDLEQCSSFHFADVKDDEYEDEDGHGTAHICSSMPASLHVRIIPRSSDPV
ncbi:autophagy-related protein 9-like [Phragmites australis]|uniref:autophagy-related protein 9-like n=1 Tax=Phragmites australis TaxID=29695 RepID=UPI002D76A567|nr:autophagy-related protein 9-like [Phragmites australis]